MIQKIAIPILDDEIVPRFDLATEVLIIIMEDRSRVQDKKIIVLPRSSGDELCHILLAESVSILICGAIEDEYYQFLKWKEVEIFDAVVGKWHTAVAKWQADRLAPGDILVPRMLEGKTIQRKDNVS